MNIIQDLICAVYAGQKSKAKINLVLNHFIPNYNAIHEHYDHPTIENYTFQSNDEMLKTYINTPNIRQSFFWNEKVKSKFKYTVGATITTDNQTIITLTLDGTDEDFDNHFKLLKLLLNSEIGVCSYIQFPIFEDGKDFIERYAK